MQALSTSSFTDYGNDVSGHQIAIDDFVSGDLPDQSSQDGAVDLGINQENNSYRMTAGYPTQSAASNLATVKALRFD